MKPIELREADFKRAVEAYKGQYKEAMIQEFFDYWTEPNKSNTKMRFELEKTWHLGRRLARWASNGFGVMEKTKPQIEKPKARDDDFGKLDKLLSEYKRRPSEFPFDAFGKWYDFMKAHKLLKPFTKEEVDLLIEIYKGDREKCRCAVVQRTLDGYVNAGLMISDIIEMRQKISA
jgi:hypothetical protein